MKRLFFKKNLILKTFLLLFLFVILFFSANFFYNQNKAILAAEEEEEEEIDYEKLKCGREIPVGEAMEKTGKFLEEIIRELEIIEENSYLLIETHKKMEDLAKKCSMENCTPECEFLTIDDVELPVCIKKSCQGDPCPEKEKIEELFTKITNFNEAIQESKDKIYKLIYEETESLCTKENEDIGTWWEKLQCASITMQEAIRRKLNLSREEFDKCYISPADIEKVILGEKTGKYPLSCEAVSKEDFPRYTKTEEEVEGEKMPVCTSSHNWFCCTDTP